MQDMRELLRSGLGRALRDWEPLDRITAAWPVAAGGALAAHGQPTGLEAGTLTVVVDDTVWLSRMLPLRDTLARELSRIASVAVREIHFMHAARERARPTAAPSVRPHANRTPIHKPGRGARP